MTGPESPQSDRPSSVSTTEQGEKPGLAAEMASDLEICARLIECNAVNGTAAITLMRKAAELLRATHPAASAEAERGKGEIAAAGLLNRAAPPIPQVTEEEIAQAIHEGWWGAGTWGETSNDKKDECRARARAVLDLLSSKASTTGKGGE